MKWSTCYLTNILQIIVILLRWKGNIRASEAKMVIEVKRKALKDCNMEDDRDIIKKIDRLASENTDEFLAESVSCSKSKKLVKVVNELFNERVK